MQVTGGKAVSIAFERPMLDPELRPALVRLPGRVRFAGWIESKGKVLVVVPAAAVASVAGLDRAPLWRDFDDAWRAIAATIERKARAGQFDSRPDERTGLPQIVLAIADLAPGAGGTPPGAFDGGRRRPRP